MQNIKASENIRNKKREEKKIYKLKEKNFGFELVKDYCSSTSIHGIKYLGDEDKNWCEKLWWFVVFILSVIACCLLISKTWIKWKEHPVVVTFSTGQNSVWEVPFPTVTVCPLSKIEQNRYNYTNELYNLESLTENERKKFWDISLICSLDNETVSLETAQYKTNEDVIKYIEEITPEFKTTVIFKNLPYVNAFKKRITYEGICYSFNALGKYDMYTNQIKKDVVLIDQDKRSTGWNIEEGYTINSMYAYPERVSEEGAETGLNFKLYSEQNNRDFICGEPAIGYKIVVHNPAEFPRVSQKYILAPMNKQIVIAVNPKIITTSKGLLDIPQYVRKCYFAQEKQLRFFKMYTQDNCKLECIANITKLVCDCVPFYFPRDDNTSICGFLSNHCCKTARHNIQKYEIASRDNILKEQYQNDEIFQTFLKCSCLPSCASLDYEFHYSHTDYKITEQLKLNNAKLWNNSKKWEISHVKVFFQDREYIAIHRRELFGQTDFLANVGGLLGLFLGFSVLSLLEIIYFATLRICCKLYNK